MSLSEREVCQIGVLEEMDRPQLAVPPLFRMRCGKQNELKEEIAPAGIEASRTSISA
jgi:hypothetical protein